MPPKKNEEDLVSLSTLCGLLDQQKAFYKDLIKQQENSFKSFVQMIHDSNNKCCDVLNREVQDLKRCLEEVDELKATFEHYQTSSIQHRGSESW